MRLIAGLAAPRNVARSERAVGSGGQVPDVRAIGTGSEALGIATFACGEVQRSLRPYWPDRAVQAGGALHGIGTHLGKPGP